MSRPKKHHLLAKCYQENWADQNGLVAVVSKQQGVWRRVPPKNQFRRKNLLSYRDDDGFNPELEVTLRKVENDAIWHVRRLNNGDRDSGARSAAARLCAIHFARSESALSISKAAERAVLEDHGIGPPDMQRHSARSLGGSQTRRSFGFWPRMQWLISP